MKNRKRPQYEFSAIGTVRSPFADRFGVPRQSGLAVTIQGRLKFDEDPDLKTALRTLDQFSHLWVVFVFHERGSKDWKPSVRPPRLGGQRKVGVLASRSPHRPNPIGLSVVKIEAIDLLAPGGPEISVSGLDLLDGTPILDVKPYLPAVDSIPEADAGWAKDDLPLIPVTFSPEADFQVSKLDPNGHLQLRLQLHDVLSLDPRPAFQKRQSPIEKLASEGLTYGFDLAGFDVQYQIRSLGFLILAVQKISS